jgi:L-lactate dehydrogenase complex protein LldG
MSARQRILDRLRQAAPTAAALPVFPPEPTNNGHLQGNTLNEALPRFIAALEAAHAEVIDARTESWVARLQDFCKTRSLNRLWMPGGRFPATVTTVDCVVERFAQPIETCKNALFDEVDAGLTVAECAIADTGILVLRSSPEQPRTLSLVPPLHCCLINVNRMYASLNAALAGENWAAGLPSNLIFISGPSKTADIQQTLAYGAHGPKELIVFLIDEDVLL